MSHDTSPHTILTVDDDPSILMVLEARLVSAGYQVVAAENGAQALDILKTRRIDLMLSDIRMPGMDGMELMATVERLYPRLPIILLTAYGSIPDAVKAIQRGAVDYLTKPFDGQELLFKVGQALGAKGVPMVKSTEGADYALWYGKSSAMRDLYDVIERVAPRDVNVLVLGESGTGKERVAHLIHQLSPRKNGPLVVVDCGSTPAGLLESELFGHVKGSFTHAVRDKKGLIEEADKGTLFLDEIGNISPEMQVRLLRFLENRTIRRIGDTKEITVSTRVVAATNADLPTEVKAGRFREDLYYRLRVVTLRLPPLRERREDVPILAKRFVERFCREMGMPLIKIPQVTEDAMLAYDWPGNVRELKNAIEAGVVLSRDGLLRADDLQIGLPSGQAGPGAGERPDGAWAGDGDALSLDESERAAIIKALEKTNWVQKDAAPLLGVSRRALNYKIQKYGIEIPHRRRKS